MYIHICIYKVSVYTHLYIQIVTVYTQYLYIQKENHYEYYIESV